MNPKTRIITIITLTIIFMVGIHAIDMGASLEITNQALGKEAFIGQSLATTFKPYQLYHIGIILSLVSFMFLSAMAAGVF